MKKRVTSKDKSLSPCSISVVVVVAIVVVVFQDEFISSSACVSGEPPETSARTERFNKFRHLQPL